MNHEAVEDRHGASLDALLTHKNAFTEWRAVAAKEAEARFRASFGMRELAACRRHFQLLAAIDVASLADPTPTADSLARRAHATKGISRRYFLRRIYQAKLERTYRAAYTELWGKLLLEA